ncbi:MAG: c-type cytochrome [Kiloniellales bacterium]
MRRLALWLAMLAGLSTASAAAADGDPKRGAQVYRVCVACHALEPGLHLTGPSLANVVGRAAGKAQGYLRYSPGLKEAAFEWNAAALDGWLKNPAEMIPGNYMAFEGIDDAQGRADLIAFLEIAGALDGGERGVAEGLMPAAYLRAQAPQPIEDAPPQARTSSIRHCGDSYFIKTDDGRETPYWEKNIRLKIDSANSGPPPGVAVLLQAGMQGDRFSVIFSSLADLTSIVQEKC